MKSLRIALLLLGVLLLFAYCQKDTLESLPEGPEQEVLGLKHLAGDVCKVDQTLYAGAGQNDISRATAVGSITALLDYPMLHVKYKAYPGFSLGEVHLWIGTDWKMIPKNAAPGQFPFKKMPGAAGSYTFTIDLSKTGIKADDLVYAAAHGVVNMPGRKESFWAIGQYTFIQLGIAKKWGWVFEIDLKKCQPAADGQPCPGMPYITDSRDGNKYPTVMIGGKCWIKQNLRYLDEIILGSTDYMVYGYTGTSKAEAMALDHYKNYGVLYNWVTAKAVCPTGWRLPSDAEWTQLTEHLINKHPEINLSNVGNALKSCRQVNSPLGGDCATSMHPRWDEHPVHYGLDVAGFSALPAGSGYFMDSFSSLGKRGYFWTATEDIPGSPWARSLNYDKGEVTPFYTEHHFAFSVRCIKE